MAKKKTDNVGISQTLEQFFSTESAGGILLVCTTILAMIIANSSFAPLYDLFLHTKISIFVGDVGLSKTTHHWINDGLMAIFFFLVGLEIKREFLAGELSNRKTALLPAVAALGGMAIPALLFWWVNKNEPLYLSGWAIPCATDIAFALGILSLFGSRVPVSIKALLMAIAVMDDLGAVIIIALFYTASLSTTALACALACIVALFAISRCGVKRPAAYILIGGLLWLSVLKSGVHATLAGVIAALFIPMHEKQDDNMLENMVHTLHPWVSFMIMPIFAFANAGVSLAGVSFANLLAPLPLGIAAGLFVGKQVGVFAALASAIKLGIAEMPSGARWGHLYGVSLLCGIGFTMSLFIGSLAYATDDHQTAVRLGVLAGSLLSAVAGLVVMRLCIKRH